MVMKKEEHDAVMQKTVHLIMKHKYYDLIANGNKLIEFRETTDYWRKRILPAKYVVFHKGYTKTTMKFKISYIRINEFAVKIEIHLGERVDDRALAGQEAAGVDEA